MDVPLEGFKKAFDIVNAVPAGVVDTSRFVKMKVAAAELRMRLSGVVTAESHCRAGAGTWVGTVERRYLAAFLAAAATKTVVASVSKSHLILQAGSQRVQLPLVEVKGNYAAWPGTGTVVAFDEERIADIGMAAGYVATAPGSENLAAVALFPGYGLIATDSVALVGVLTKHISKRVMLPRELADLVKSMAGASLVVDKAGAALQSKAGYVYQSTSARLEKYPETKLRGLLDKARVATPVAMFSIPESRAALEVIGKISLAGNDAMVQLQFAAGDQVRLHVDSEGGSFDGALKNLQKRSGKDCRMLWPLGRVRPWLERLADLELEHIWCGLLDQVTFLRANVKAGPTYLLLLADMSSGSK